MFGLWRLIRRILAGRGVDAALRRHTEAADALDAALREVLKR